jgi:hypothetical protein
MLQARNYKILYLGLTVLLALAFAISSVGTQPAQAAPSTQISNGWMPFSGYFPNSTIHLNGWVHVVARWKSLSSGGAQLDVDVNLPAANVTVTTDTGISYFAYGAGQSSVFFPNDPLFPTDPLRVISPAFLRALPPNPILPPNPVLPPNPIQPFGLQFDLVFDAAGALDFDASLVQVVKLPGLGDG